MNSYVLSSCVFLIQTNRPYIRNGGYESHSKNQHCQCRPKRIGLDHSMNTIPYWSDRFGPFNEKALLIYLYLLYLLSDFRP